MDDCIPRKYKIDSRVWLGYWFRIFYLIYGLFLRQMLIKWPSLKFRMIKQWGLIRFKISLRIRYDNTYIITSQNGYFIDGHSINCNWLLHQIIYYERKTFSNFYRPFNFRKQDFMWTLKIRNDEQFLWAIIISFHSSLSSSFLWSCTFFF